MLGTTLSLGFSAFFGVSQVISRRGVLRVSVNYVANMTIFCGPLFFAFAALLSGEVSKLGQFTWQALGFFALSGIIHFALGRSFGFRSLLMIGATRSNVVTGLNAVVSVVLAILVLNEKLTVLTALGLLLSLAGPLIMGIQEGNGRKEKGKTDFHDPRVDARTMWIGILFGLGAALFWGSSPIFIKLGLDNGGTPIVGSLIAYVAASLVISYQLFDGETRQQLFSPDRAALQLGLGAAMTTNVAQLLRFIALDYAPVITVSLLARTIPVWVLIFSYMLNRKTESFSKWVILGNGLLLTGTVLVIL